MTTPHRPFAIVGIVALAAVTLLVVTPAHVLACSCGPSASPCRLFSASDAIFIGTPVAVETRGSLRGTKQLRFHFEVQQAIKGVAAKTVDVDTLADSAACGYPFERGVKYLVYGSHGTDALEVSFCSRTGPLESRSDDVALLLETAAGRTVRSRLFGSVYRLQLELDGFFSHYGDGRGLRDVPIRVQDGTQPLQQRTDALGRFSIAGVAPGRHVVEAQLPAPYAPLFPRDVSANVDECFGEVSIPVVAASLRGTARPSDGVATPGQTMLRLAQVGPDGGVAFERSTLAFTEPDGAWKLSGLPPGRYLLGVSAFEPPTPDTPYPTRWYPGASKPEQATVLTVSDDHPISVDFRLPARLPAATVSGITVGIDGTPVSGVSVTLRDAEERGPTSGGVGYATSDERGRFTIAALRNRHYRIQGIVLRQGGAQSDWIDLPDEKTQQGVTIALRPRR